MRAEIGNRYTITLNFFGNSSTVSDLADLAKISPSAWTA
jgi:hypothetical protein